MHYTGFGARSQATPQTEPIPGSNQQRNNAGGFSFVVDDMTRLKRFLVLGTTGGTYYVGERKLTKENLACVDRLLAAGRGKEVVALITEISTAGRGVSNDPALFALARCCAADDVAVRQAAYNALGDVARIGTHLFHFMAYVKEFRGRGRAHRRALKDWYNLQPAKHLAYELLKYQSRDGWSQRDVLRLTRPKPPNENHNALYRWVTKGWEGATADSETAVPSEESLTLIWAFEKAKHASDVNQVADLITTYRLPREAVPTVALKSVNVWKALLADMPLEAMTRNLGVMTANGTLAPLSNTVEAVVRRLRDAEAIKKARLHPIKLLAALKTYAQGHGERGALSWTPVPAIIDALNDAFFLAFGNVTPTGKRLVLALDVSGSMGSSRINAIPGLTACDGAAAMALVTAATEPHYTMMAFSRGFVPLAISPKSRLDDVVRSISGLPFDATDCSLPMLWAMHMHVEADAFIVYTDNETYAGRVHPVQALRQYRQVTGIPAKLIVVGMTATQFSIADPDDAGMLDVVGFDVATPQAISEFLTEL